MPGRAARLTAPPPMADNWRMRHRSWAVPAGIALAALGAWAGKWLGGSPATAGLGAAFGAVTGGFAPSLTSWLAARRVSRKHAASAAELPAALGQPSRLLNPHRGVVGFTGRDSEKARLAAWCEDPTAPVLRLVTGPGGTGKTRLALALAYPSATPALPVRIICQPEPRPARRTCRAHPRTDSPDHRCCLPARPCHPGRDPRPDRPRP